MSLISYHRGQGSIILRIKILDSSVATGAGKTGLSSATSGLIISTIVDNEAAATVYTQAGGTIDSITTLGTFAAPTATHCRFKELDNTNHKGVYEIQIADARFSVASCKSLLLSISGAANAAETDAVIPLTDIDFYDAVRAALTSLPNTTAGANGGLPTIDANLEVKASTLRTNNDKTGYSLTQAFPANFSSFSLTAGGQVTVGTNNDKTGYALSSAAIQAIYDFATSLLTTVGSIGKLFVTQLDTNIGSRLASSSYTAPDNADITAIKAKTDNLPASPAAVGDIPTAAQNATGLLDAVGGVETGWTVRQLFRLSLAGICGARTLFATSAPVVQNPAGTKNRLTGSSIDANGNGTWTTDVT